jgi:hypothetical protein
MAARRRARRAIGSGGMSATTSRAPLTGRNAASRAIPPSPSHRTPAPPRSVAGMSTSRLPRWIAPVSTAPGSMRTDARTLRAKSHAATDVRTRSARRAAWAAR